MDKNAIKKYAVWARNELIARVSQKAEQYEISDTADPKTDAVRGVLLSKDEKEQRAKLIGKVKEKGIDQVMEEVAYTWFNRFSALRFMEVNNYLPTRVRVFTDESGAFKPQILDEAIHMDLKGLDMEKVYALKEANDNDALFKYLIITQCNALSEVLPGMFQKISDYTELLFPDNLLREGSVVEQMVTTIPEEDWKDQIQIIGWLYQYYNTEPNELVYDGSLSKSRIPKELLSAATTIYTPDWIVHYMVENSLGRFWMDGHPESTVKSNWKYYLEGIEQSLNVQTILDDIHNKYENVAPEEIRVIDICSGSGHILAYMFDVLMQIYTDYGIQTRDAVRSIVENNIWGLDIDNRAAQLAYFSVMMKAVQYDSRFLRRNEIPQPHVFAICESNQMDSYTIDSFANNNEKLKKDILTIVDELHDAKEYGSIVNISQVDFKSLYRRFAECRNEININQPIIEQELYPMIQVAEALGQKYHVVVTNPPYLGSKRFSQKLNDYVTEKYNLVKSDLSMVMYYHTLTALSKKGGYISFITTTSWMFLSSFSALRKYVLSNYDFDSIVDLGTELFDGKVGHNPITAWVNQNVHTNKKMVGIRLVDFCYSNRDQKEPQFFNLENRYFPDQQTFSKIPDAPIAYWASNRLIEAFDNKKLGEIAAVKQGLATGENNRFLRLWYECEIDHINFNATSTEEALRSGKKWFPYNKGGEYRKWYGNNDYVVNWEKDGVEIKNFKDDKGKLRSRPQNTQYYFKPCFTWSKISSGSIAFRYKPSGNIFDVAGTSVFPREGDLLYLEGLCNSKVALQILNVISPTLNYEVGHVCSIPVIINKEYKQQVEMLVRENIELAKQDWDSFEVSWDFKHNPLIRNVGLISEAFAKWEIECEDRFQKVKENEEKLNAIFIDAYHLNGEIFPEVDSKDITIHRADLKRDIKYFISYSVGCMFGRYSLDQDGLIYAGGDWDESQYKKFQVDHDGIIPICDDEYFEDDIVGLFIKFIRTVYGDSSLEANIQYIADALGGKGTPREIIRNYFLNDFYADHCSMCSSLTSGKRPYYWQFDSGKKNGFKCLIYMHRYQADTIARIRTDYVHEQQARYRTAIGGLERQVSLSTGDRIRLKEQIEKYKGQSEELSHYEEKIHHLADQMISIDLDDGVRKNYEIFKDVLVKIR